MTGDTAGSTGGPGDYVLGIDGLPLGRMAAMAAGGVVESTFPVDAAAGVPAIRGLASRVEAAVAEATARRGAVPAEVRLVCVDDGGDGSDTAAVAEWLAGRRIAFRLLDLVGPDDAGGSAGSGVNPGADPRSEARARDAALF